MRNLILCAGLLALAGCDRQNAEGSQADAPAAPTPGAGLDRSTAGKPMPTVGIVAPDGKPTTLAQFVGRPMLVNLWATWCAPCIKELPTLARLASSQQAVAVVTLSQDMGEQKPVRAFLAERKLALPAWHDPEMAVSTALGVNILPTTILYGSDGKEIWRYSGDLDWTGAAAGKLLAEAK